MPSVSSGVTENNRRVGQGLFKVKRITDREKQVLRLVAKGFKNSEIAKRLGVKVKTVETHQAHIMNKLALHNVAQLICYAIQSGIIS